MADSKNTNVAVKMSWASSRETTRIEDSAYCLMGLFGINMPLLYGEGRNAFIRLQLEILKVSDDETIFAWDRFDDRFHEISGLLAPSPALFYDSGDIRRILFDEGRPGYSVTNKGLRMELLLSPKLGAGSPSWKLGGGDLHLAPLNCTRDLEGHP